MCFANKNIKHEGLILSKSKRILIDGSEVARTSKTEYLGVYIDDSLTFSCHVSKVLSKVYYIVSSLAYVVTFFNKNAKENVFNTIILPHVIYAVPVWYHFILQKDKERIMKFLKYTSTIFNLDYNMLLEKVNDAARTEFTRMANKIKYTNHNHPLYTVLKSFLQKSNRNLRNPHILPKYRTQVFRNSFIYRAALFIQSEHLECLL